ncbi:MAG: hypothetical protein R3E10_11560 [Gemmatimonadota bacterium]
MIAATLERTGQVWVTNLGVLVSFGLRLLRAAGTGLAEIGSRRGVLLVLRLTLGQIFRTLTRGGLDVLLLGTVLGLGLRTVADELGVIRPLFESAFLPIFIAGGLPLGLAVLVAARSGAPLSLKLAIRPLTHRLADPYGPPAELNAQVLPHLVSVPLTTALFFVIGQYFLMIGYTFDGSSLHSALAVDYYTAFLDSVVTGSWRSMLFGGIVAFVSCAIGVEAAERRPSDPRRSELQDAAWESTVLSTTLCTVITAALWMAR